MARTNVDIVVTVRDGASAPLDNVSKKLKNTGQAAKDTSADFIQFNKTLFTTAAFLGAFAKGFSNLKQSVEFGAELDKVTVQFERTMGPRGSFIQSLQETSNIAIDETVAMQSALHLGMLGIVKDGKEAGGLLSKFGVAAAMAGKDATKGVKDLTEAVEDGNIAKLQEYGIIKKNDAALMAQFAALNKAGGIYGQVIVKQHQLALVQKILTQHTKDHMFAVLSTGQVVEAFGVQFQNAKRHIGVFLANAIRPLLEKLIPLMVKFKEFLFNSYRMNKEILFLGKSFLALGTVLTGFIATLGTLKLAVKLLGFAGIGMPGLLMATVALAAGFVGLTGKADGLVKKLEVLGAFFKGIYELVTNFDPETGMSKISAATEKILADNGILGFVDMISAVIVTVKTTLKDIVDFVSWAALKIDNLVSDIFGTVNDGIKDSKKWTTWWTSDALSNFDKVKRAALILGGVLGSIFLGKKLFDFGGFLLNKTTGGLFGGGGKGPKGTASDPIYTIPIGQGLGKTLGNIANIPFIGKIAEKLISAFNNLILKSNFLAEVLTNPAGKLAGLWTALQVAFTAIVGNLGVILTSTIPELVLMLGGAATAGVTAVLGAASLAIGYGVGKFMNWILSFFPKLDEWINKKLFDLISLLPGVDRSDFATAEEAGITKSDNANLVKDVRNKQGGPQVATNNPLSTLNTQTSSDLDIVQSIGTQMQTMKQSARDEMQTSVEKALMSADANGRFISPEELEGFRKVFSESLAGDENLKAMGDKARQTQIRIPMSSRN